MAHGAWFWFSAALKVRQLKAAPGPAALPRRWHHGAHATQLIPTTAAAAAVAAGSATGLPTSFTVNCLSSAKTYAVTAPMAAAAKAGQGVS